MSEPLPPECGQVAPSLVELALGVLAGEERERAVAHVEACGRCSALVSELSAAADELLHLAPGVEPPVGFEARVFERLGVKRPKRRPALPGLFRPSGATRRQWAAGRRSRGKRASNSLAGGWSSPRRPGRSALRLAGVLAAAAVVFAGGVLAGGGFGGKQPSPGSLGAPTALETAALRSAGEVVGNVMVYAGNPTWVFMYMDDQAWTGELRCQVVEYQGPALTLGEFWLSGGRGAWAARVAEPAGRLKEARVVDSRGHVLAVAHLS